MGYIGKDKASNKLRLSIISTKKPLKTHRSTMLLVMVQPQLAPKPDTAIYSLPPPSGMGLRIRRIKMKKLIG